MEVRSFARNAPITPKKARLILNEIRGKRVDEAIALLRFMPTPHARLVAKAVRSAVANAENNYNLQPRTLRIARWKSQSNPNTWLSITAGWIL
jgi:large subunit ribosomal protein L22